MKPNPYPYRDSAKTHASPKPTATTHTRNRYATFNKPRPCKLKALSILILTAVMSYCNQSINSQEGDDFQLFWTEFRKAIMREDSLMLIELVNFPLKTHGVEDTDPQYLIYKDKFYQYFKICLNEDTGESMKSETNLDFIKKTEEITDYRFYTKGGLWHRITQLEFRKINGKWKLCLIYFNTRDYK